MLTKHVALVQVSKHEVLLLCSVANDGLDKNIRKSINWMYNFTNSSCYKIYVISLFIYFLDLISLSYHFFLEIYFKVLYQSSREHSEFWNISNQKFYFFLTCWQLSFWYDIEELLSIKFNQYALVWYYSCIITPRFMIHLFHAKVLIWIHTFLKFELVRVHRFG